MTHDPHTLAELAAAACDGTITPEQVAELEQRLVEDAVARTEYSQHCEFDADLRLYLRSSGALDAALASVERTAALDPTVTSQQTLAPKSRPKSLLNWASRHPKGPAIAIAATLLIAALVVMGLMPVKVWMASGEKAKPEDREPAEKKNFVAKLTNWQDDKWAEGTRPPLDDPRLKAGKRLVLESGLAVITYGTGAQVVLEGPAEFIVGRTKGEEAGHHALGGKPGSDDGDFVLPSPHNSGFLKHGKLVARVEGNDAKGFVVATPSAIVEDLGTEFGVEVRRDGFTAVGVIRGEVEVVTDQSGVRSKPIALKKGEAVELVANNGKTDARLVNINSLGWSDSGLPLYRTIGVNFNGGNHSVARHEQPGVAFGTNWNNIVAHSGKGGPVALQDDRAMSTGAALTFHSQGGYSGFSVPATKNHAANRMYSTGLAGSNNGGEVSISVSGIPYARYDVYVFASSDDADTDVLSITDGTTTYYYASDGATNGGATTLRLTTSTTVTAPTRGPAQYQVFQGLTNSTFTLKTKGSISGKLSNNVFGLHIVERPPTTTTDSTDES